MHVLALSSIIGRSYVPHFVAGGKYARGLNVAIDSSGRVTRIVVHGRQPNGADRTAIDWSTMWRLQLGCVGGRG